MEFNLFYAWQSDRLKLFNHYFIRDAAKEALRQITKEAEVEESPRIDYDTWNIPGTPEIAGTIFRKIEKCGLFLADITFVGTVEPQRGSTTSKRTPNPNVLVELGYAAAKIGWDRIILVMNTYYGSPDEMIFDLVHRRWPQRYCLGPDDHDKKKNVFNCLVEMIRVQVRLAMDAVHEGTNDIISKLDTNCHDWMHIQGKADSFHLRDPVNKAQLLEFQRYYQALTRLLDLGLICTHYDIPHKTYAYHWTYQGRLALIQLGIRQPPKSSADSTDQYTFTATVNMRPSED